jgi:D-beta-D-heptose 7-phosphate kinase/D-beta-D-heptose 1-phosphate adenosyltransferase
MRDRPIAILGDLMLDRYLIGDIERISPEAPVPVVSVRDRRVAPGGAANVAANVVALGGEALLVGVVGEDTAGLSLRECLRIGRISDERVVTLAGRPTTMKTRVIARGQQVVRIDEEEDAPVLPETSERLTLLVKEAIAAAAALIIEDYNKGVLTSDLIGTAIKAAKARDIPIVVDPKFRHFFDFKGATLFKPNRRELADALGAGVDLSQVGALQDAVHKLGVENLLLTLGPQGMLLVRRDGKAGEIPSRAREVFDVSGAGDTVTGWAGAALAARATVLEAALLANLAAGVEVAKAGVATVSPEEVLAAHALL